MKVKEIMITSPMACTMTTSAADAARMMWQNDCGILPVVAEGGKIVGLITDRDICMAAVLTGRHLVNIAVEDVTSGKVFSCKADDDVGEALKMMRENKIRRLPVTDDYGLLAGMISMNDIVLSAQETKDKKAPPVTYADVVNTYKSICAHRMPLQVKSAAV